ncbi:hypothetical protein [Tropicimonas sp. IMCC6043]|uniref:hypothetical protein n=1 Tax=Tropicimonas sp. IMCC6043 TaxID=2510645 RepID=UPI00101D03A1|nr:hypothetical protein [Tropicimonas sp. IMCC6043]RYH12333.1 hypothetical protein EU800_01880 [Tropicimonas sp. IMCC6043]
MLSIRLFSALPALLLLSQAALAVPLHFDDPLTRLDGSSTLGAVARSRTIEFTNVATESGKTVDLRITAQLKKQTIFGRRAPHGSDAGDPGYIPNYGATAAAPDDDLGLLYYGRHTNDMENGLRLTFDFFDGTGARSGSFAESLSLAELDLVLYDIDGETTSGADPTSQSEYLTAYLADGLTAYALGRSATPLAASLGADSLQLSGHRSDLREDDVSGAVRLIFHDTSSFTLDLGSEMLSGADINPVFTGLDGDMSLFPEADFSPLVSLLPEQSVAFAVPLPSGLLLMMSGGGVLLLSRRRISRRKTDRDLRAPAA